MRALDPPILLAGLALALALAGVVSALRARRSGSGRGLAALLLGCAVAALASAQVSLATSSARSRADDDARHAVATRLLTATADAKLALDERVRQVTAGLREELHSRDRHRSQQDERITALAADLHALQVADAELRRMLVDVAGTHGLLITRDGRFRGGDGGSTFEPCGWGEAWQVTFSPSPEAKPRLVALLDGRSEAVVTFTGVLSVPGAFGSDGASRHLFLVMDGEPSAQPCD